MLDRKARLMYRRSPNSSLLLLLLLSVACSTELASEEASTEQNQESSPCSPSYLVKSKWDGGFTADLRVINTSDSPLNRWTLTFRFRGNEKVQQAWNGTVKQDGNRVTFTPDAWNSSVPSGSALQVGFMASGTPTDIVDVAVDGQTCGTPGSKPSPSPATSSTGSKPSGTIPDAPTSPGNPSTAPITGSPSSSAIPQGPVREAMATHFDGLGSPAGGCGIPESEVDSPYFVALNVQNTPGDYSSFLPRPVTSSSAVGEFNNGKNCGRWVRVTIGDICTGVNSGEPGKGFCTGGTWKSDGYNGATLDMLVTDSCQDNNGWCRDDRYHLDLSTKSLGAFSKDGQRTPGLATDWSNRKISWSFIDAPNYTGDIKIGFRNGSEKYWSAIAITHLPNGISGVQVSAGGQWVAANMMGDNGQVFLLPGNADRPYRIRVLDVNGKAIQNGRTYQFDFPSSCGAKCTAPYTAVPYTAQ